MHLSNWVNNNNVINNNIIIMHNNNIIMPFVYYKQPFHAVSEVIVGTSVAAGLLLVGVCLVLIITGSIKIIGRRSKKFTRVTKASHQK